MRKDIPSDFKPSICAEIAVRNSTSVGFSNASPGLGTSPAVIAIERRKRREPHAIRRRAHVDDSRHKDVGGRDMFAFTTSDLSIGVEGFPDALREIYAGGLGSGMPSLARMTEWPSLSP